VVLKDNYTSVSQKLGDFVLQIQLQSAESPSSRRLLEPAWQQEDVQIPGAGITIRSVVNFFKTELGFPDTHIGGEITETEDHKYAITIAIRPPEKYSHQAILRGGRCTTCRSLYLGSFPAV
jgi:hypothetical protein